MASMVGGSCVVSGLDGSGNSLKWDWRDDERSGVLQRIETDGRGLQRVGVLSMSRPLKLQIVKAGAVGNLRGAFQPWHQ